MKDILIQNGTVLFFTEDTSEIYFEKKDILLSEGKIQKIEDRIESSPDYTIIDATQKCVMPGLINTHTHLPMSIFRETFEGCTLYDWLQNKIWPLEANLTDEQVYDATMLSYLEQIRTGTTCTNDQYFFSESIRKAARKSKVRTVLTRVLMDSDGERASQKRFEEFENLYNTRTAEDSLITYTVAPHGLYTCSSECLKKASKLADQYHLPVHVHFLESMKEADDIERLHRNKWR